MKILIGETRIPAPGRKSEERIKREKEIEAFVLSGAAVAIADELPSKDPAYEKCAYSRAAVAVSNKYGCIVKVYKRGGNLYLRRMDVKSCEE